MTSFKDIIGKGMNMVMLDCDKATMYATQNDVKSLGCLKRMQLKMHLASCKLCRSFVEQSKIITNQINLIKEIDESNFQEQLTKEQKENLQETVESNMQNH